MSSNTKAYAILGANTLAFTVCFACWMTYGVLITWLIANGVLRWDNSTVGLIIGIPVLTGSLMRLPLGLLTDRYGGRPVFTLLLLLSAIPMYLVGECTTTTEFALAGLGFGLTGASFAVGIAFTSAWFPAGKQGTALGIFGAGNAGGAITSMAAPWMLNSLTQHGAEIEAWRTLPKMYAAALVVTGILFFLMTTNRKPEGSGTRTLAASLSILRHMRVWRFGLYYFLMFGMFVALAQWLIPYYVNVYALPVITAGLLASIFTLPSGVIRAVGGVLSDKLGARKVMYWTLGLTLAASVLLVVPRMDIYSPGQGVMARAPGTVTLVAADRVEVNGRAYPLIPAVAQTKHTEGEFVLPYSRIWQEAAVSVGDKVEKNQLLARGVTHIGFRANIWVFTGLVFVIGITLGIGKAAVYRYIPDYFPRDVGVVGGMVGVIGGLGGFFGPWIFGLLLDSSGLWTTTWMFIAVLTLACLLWLLRVTRNIVRQHAPQQERLIEPSSLAVSGGKAGSSS